MPKAPNPLAAALWMGGALASFSAMAVAGRLLAGRHDTFEIMAWRSLVGLVLVIAFAVAKGRLGDIRRDSVGQHFIRNVFHFTGQNLWFLALTMIPLAQVFALEFTSPIWVILLSPLVLGERLTTHRIAAAAIGFAGILMVTRPDFAAPDPGVLAAAAAAVCFATSVMMTKALTRGEGIVSILFWLTFMQLLMGAGLAAWDGRIAWPSQGTLPLLVLIGVTGLTAHLSLTTALSLAPASFVMPIDFLRLPLIALVGVAFFDEPVELFVILGGLVIFAGNWINLRGERRAALQQQGVTNS